MFLMKRPCGLSLEIGFGNNETWFPQIYIGPQMFGRIRARSRYTLKDFYKRQTIDIAMFGGLKIDVGFGTVRRPIPKFWKSAFWSRDKQKKNTETQPWNSGNHWFVLTVPLCPYVFLSLLAGSRRKKMPGFYIGGRTSIVDRMTHQKAIFDRNGDVLEWLNDHEKGDPVYAWGYASENGNIYVEPTASIRTDFNH